MEIIKGTSNKLLEIDLSKGDVKTSTININDRQMYLGGKGLALKILYDRLKPGIDPLSENNIVVFMMGEFLGTGAPCSARFEAVTKSPLTNITLSSSCGGPFGMAFKTAGYDGLILHGKSDKPIIIKISSQGVQFEDASPIWGKDTEQSQDYFKLGSKDGALLIGPAGENLVRFANIKSGHRFLGRGGMGAVLGSKNIKAIVAYGGAFKIVPVEPEKFKKYTRKAVSYINNNNHTSNLYRKFGTASHTMTSNKAIILPVNNFKDGASAHANEISGQSYAENHSPKSSSCKACPILCGHKGTFSNGKIMQFPEYETTGLLGSNLGNYNREILAEWNEQCGLLGIDTISAGTTLSYVMEATEKGLIQTGLKFDSPAGVAQMLNDIAHRKGIGNEISNGSKWLSEKYGGKEFAIHVKGMEMSAYDPRGSWGQGLSYAVANRGGCHLAGAVFGAEVSYTYLKADSIKHKAFYTKFFEDFYCSINLLHTCQFTAYAYMQETFVVKYTPFWLLQIVMRNLPRLAVALIDVSLYNKIYSAITGIKLSQKQMFRIANRVNILERFMNTREGISRKDDTLPERLLREPCLSDKDKRVVPLEKMLDKYYKLKGYNSDGIPTKATLEKNGIVVNQSLL